MPLTRVFIAMTLDGYIARADGGYDHLDAYAKAYPGFKAFFDSIGSVVMGRATYDQFASLEPWPYADKPVRVLTTRPLGPGRDTVGPIHEASRAALDELAAEFRGDIWILGGGRCIAAFDEAGLIDRWEIGIVPVRLGDGIPLFPAGRPRTDHLRLIRLQQHDMGLIECWYEPAPNAPEPSNS